MNALTALIVLLLGGLFAWFKWFRGSGSASGENPVNQPSHETLQQWYFDDLRHECQYYSLEDLDEEHSGDHLSLQLSDIYCDQLVRMPEISSEAIRPEARPVPQEVSAIPLLEAISKLDNHRIVIRGIVGSGKSSFVNFLVNCIILSFQNSTPDIFPDTFSRRPVIRLLLRKLGANITDAKAPRNFLAQAIMDQIEDHIKSFAKFNREQPDLDSVRIFSKDYLKKIKTNGVILLDGLDEVASGDKRKAVLQAIREFVDDESTAKNIHVIIASRPHAYDNPLTDFIRLEIEPMQWPQVEHFICHWYRQIAGKKLHHPDDPEYQNRAMNLISQISDRPSLRIMTETPLLLTLLLALDAANYRLPRSRAELYDRAVKLLLQRWHINLLSYKESLEPEEQITLSILAEVGESTENLRKALCRLALESYEDASKTVTKDQQDQGHDGDDIVFRQSQVLGHINKSYRQSMDAEAVQYFLQYRSNLLVAHGDEHLCFVHKSFHEFLAAEGFKYREQSKDSLHKLLEHSEQRNWWREVLLFWMNRKEIGELADFIRQYVLQDLQDLTGSEKQNHAGIILICAQAAIEAEFESEILSTEETGLVKLFQAMQQKLMDLMKVESIAVEFRADCGRLLGQLGDYRPGVAVIRDAKLKPIKATTHSLNHAVPDISWERIPAGTFQMGSADNDKNAFDREKPMHRVTIAAFKISRFPITNAQYQCFIDAGGYENSQYWQQPKAALAWREGQSADLSFLSDADKKIWEGLLSGDTQRQTPRLWGNRNMTNANCPVVGICWYEALAYCAWLNECLKQQDLIPDNLLIRLPREEEWEYAARGQKGLNYAWGNQTDPNKGNYSHTKLKETSSVGLFAPGIAFDNNIELYDMSGNVWEWTQSRWGTSFDKPTYEYTRWDQQSLHRNDLEPVELRILRGGSWGYDRRFARCAARIRNHPNSRLNDIGFRVVFSLAADD